MHHVMCIYLYVVVSRTMDPLLYMIIGIMDLHQHGRNSSRDHTYHSSQSLNIIQEPQLVPPVGWQTLQGGMGEL
jgi:hypothetical protein